VKKFLGPADVVRRVFAQPVAMPIQVIIKAPSKSPAGTLVSILLLDHSPLPSAYVQYLDISLGDRLI
jgi:hypothetical protein